MRNLFYLFTILLVCACTPENTQITTIKKTFSDYGINLITREECKYIDLIYDTPMFCFISEQEDWGYDHNFNRYYSEWFFDTNYGEQPNVTVSYNDVTLYETKNKYQNREYDIFSIGMQEPNNAYFRISSPYDEQEIQLIPIPPITITKPDPTGQPYAPVIACDANNFILEWNAAPENPNGVFILVSWNGMCADNSIENDYIGVNIKNADLVEDNGRCLLNPHLFDGIPESALINISIIRGSVDKIENFQFFEDIHLPMVFGIMSRSNYNTIILRRL
jgi:hypothetical protein